MIREWTKRDAGWFMLALAWLALTIGIRPLALPDEGRYVGAAWEMLTSGNWLYPTLNGLPFFHKPPLFYWITAGSLSLFGLHEWAGRLAPLLGAAIAALSLYGFVLRQKGKSVARWALLILVTQPFFFGGAQFANLDMLVAGFIGATVLLAAEAARKAERNEPYRGLLAGAYIAAAFGVLAKGLIGMVLPGMILLIWLGWNRRLALLRQLVWLPGLALFALIAVPWFVAMQARFPDFLNYFFVYNHFRRFTESGFNNPMPFWFYVPVILILTLPWSAWLLAAWKRGPADNAAQPTLRSLMWVWIAVIVGFFSIPTSKLAGYVLPALPPLAFLIAEGLHRRWGEAKGLPRPMKWTALGAVLVCISLIVANNVFNKKTNKMLAIQIAAQRHPGEPVVFLDNQFFDVPFYLGLTEPVRVFHDWRPATVLQQDDWARALFEAGRFDPVRARALLLDRSQLVQTLCAQPVTWVVAQKAAFKDYPVLPQRAELTLIDNAVAWKVTRKGLIGLCPGTPSAGSAGK
jgi:4-amino-4-deoxy-L-arabinose transferase-like glycosyltransferase